MVSSVFDCIGCVTDSRVRIVNSVGSMLKWASYIGLTSTFVVT